MFVVVNVILRCISVTDYLFQLDVGDVAICVGYVPTCLPGLSPHPLHGPILNNITCVDASKVYRHMVSAHRQVNMGSFHY